ncbi:TatD family hydrolase [Chroogloeocystis siderophila]|jgi:TatD DNase family protein|uniref:D-aminoacyl-tRNA deacylase n=1 Tax=Chroogloeocystis siderophila 5.2 s.c.1 TaxID=247279 RepID=A0A1U7HPA8_9CHRO|nr:TatD family hydrolase [Chroogloeocystis siderophila]OKH25399.1 deoxyribonuclease [Chroogloeocystis siderophila 5.2 s.c.1]
MQLIDSHVHLNFDVFEPDLPAVRARWQASDVVHLVHSCVEPAEFASIQLLAEKIPELSFAVGLHPLDVDKWTADTASQIASYARLERRVVAIGEIGLDFYKAENQAQQKEVLAQQLMIADELDLPVIIHCRDAANVMRDILQDFRQQGRQIKGVMHCWTGNPEETQWFLDLGLYVSFSGIVTFKNAKQIQESAKMVWSDRLLIETDCPFLSPVPKRSQKRNEPAFVRYVAEAVASLRGVTLEEIATQTTTNACKLFGLSV